MNGKTKVGILSLIALAVILVPTITVSAQSNASSVTPLYAKGTICGDAQIGPWSTHVFYGKSDYQGFYSLYTLNKFMLSGGNNGKVSSSSGTLTVYNHEDGKALFSATFKGMSGRYSISGSQMTLSHFTASEIIVNFNHIYGNSKDRQVHSGTYFGAHIPTQTLGCTTQDTHA